MCTLLDALIGQSYPAIEIIMIDGGSTDGTLEILKEYADTYKNIKYAVKKDVNIAQGRNIAIKIASSSLIAVTDGGCLPDRDWLKELVKPVMSDPSVDAVSGRIVPKSESRFEKFCGLFSTPKQDDSSQSGMFYGRSSLFRKSLWEEAGGYPEWLYTAEDTLFAIRAGQLGGKIVYAPDSVLYWRPRSSLRKLSKMFYLYGRGNGRINIGDIKGSLYWLRYHLVWLAALLVSVKYPPALLVSVAVLAYLYAIMVLPALKQVENLPAGFYRYLMAPAIVFTRNLSSNAGFLVGHIEYRVNPVFRRRLQQYME